MKKLFKRLVVAVLIVATLVTTQYSSAYAQVAQLDEKMQYKQYNKYWKCLVYKKYDLINSWCNSEKAQELVKDKWGIVGTKQDKAVKDKAVYYKLKSQCGDGYIYDRYYSVDYYTTKDDFSKEDQKYLPKVTVTQKNGIITIKFKNLKTYIKKLEEEGVAKFDYNTFWDLIRIQPTKGVNDGIYSYPHGQSITSADNPYGKVIKSKKWEYIQIDTRYGMYKGKVDFNVVMLGYSRTDFIYEDLKKECDKYAINAATQVTRTWSYVACSTTVNCKFDKSKTCSPAKKPVIPNTGKFK